MTHGIALLVDSAKRDLSCVIAWGRQAMKDGAYDIAVQHFTTALNLRPGLMQALIARGDCHLKLGNPERAKEDFAEVITKDSGFNRNIYVMMATAFKQTGEFRKAIRYLSLCIRQFASFRPALIARGELSLEVREFDKARVDFAKAIIECPDDILAHRGLADSLRGLGNFSEALQQYAKTIEMLRFMLSECHSQGGTRGEGNCDQEVSENGQSCQPSESSINNTSTGDTSGNTSYTQMDDASRDTTGISTEDQDGVAKTPEMLRKFLIDALMKRALLLRLVGDLEAAGECILEVLETDVRDGLALFWYAKMLLEQCRHKEAHGFLQASIQHSTELRAPALALLGALLMSASEPNCEAALRHLREAARLDASSSSIKVTLLVCQAMTVLRSTVRDPEAALSHLDRALHILTSGSASNRGKPQLPHAAGSGGVAAAVLGGSEKSPEEARWKAAKVLTEKRKQLAQGSDLEMSLDCRSFLQLVASDPQHRAAEVPFLLYWLRTIALCELCRWDEAVSACKHALAIDPKDEMAQYTFNIASGILKAKCGKFESAVARFSKAIRTRPVSSEARIHRAIALARVARAASVAHNGLESGADLESLTPAPKVMQLLDEAVQDLEAVEQQAQITGFGAPVGAAHLRAACLCSLGRPEEAHEILCLCHEQGVSGPAEIAARQNALEAEVLILLGRYPEAAGMCSAMIGSIPTSSPVHVEALMMRSCCFSELGDAESAFEDHHATISIAPDRADAYEASGECFLLHKRFNDAASAFTSAAKLTTLPSRIYYKRALCLMALGNVDAALADVHKSLRANPGMKIAVRARDGISALQSAISGDWRHAHVRFNMLLHMAIPRKLVEDRLPVLFFPHEIAVYRGICSLYLDEPCAAVQDFAAAVELAQQAFLSNNGRNVTLATRESDYEFMGQSTSNHPSDFFDEAASPCNHRLPEEIATQKGLDAFACEAQYNIALCQLVSQQHAAALATCNRLMQCQESLRDLGPQALCLCWFLIGVCHLTLQSGEELAREAFTQSFAKDPRYVDDFLRRHGRRNEGGFHTTPQASGHLQPVAPPARVGAPPLVRRSMYGAPLVSTTRPCCDAAPDAICCLRLDKMRLSSRLPPLRVGVRDVVIWGRPSVGLPTVQPAGPAPPAGLARLDLLQSQEPLPSAATGIRQELVDKL